MINAQASADDESLGSLVPGAQGRWQLPCKLNAGTTSMNVCLSDEILVPLIEYSVSAFKERKKLTKGDKELKAQFRKHMAGANDKILGMYATMQQEGRFSLRKRDNDSAHDVEIIAFEPGNSTAASVK